MNSCTLGKVSDGLTGIGDIVFIDREIYIYIDL